jgi:hypothetical protein
VAGDDTDDLRLNTLNRFAKRSPRLALEEHGHCEVPAGCGGVVLRWASRDAGVFVVAYVSCPTPRGQRTTLYVDGRPLEASRVELAAGTHLLAVRLVPEALRTGTRAVVPFLCVVRQDAAIDRDDDATIFLRSSAAADIRLTTIEPGERWAMPGYDDGAWQRPAPLSFAVETLPERWRSFGLWLAESYGAEPLELPAAPTVWLRARFEVRRP